MLDARNAQRLVAALFMALTASQAHAEGAPEPHAFDITLRGIRAADLSFTGSQDGGSYSVTGKLVSSGVMQVVRRVSYDARVTGRVRGDRYIPSAYAEATDTGKRQSESVIEYKGGVPQVISYSPAREPRRGDLDPATQGRTVDPLTALYAALRDVTAEEACTARLQIFDGRRRTEVVLSDPQPTGTGLTCSGLYRRVAGFSPEDMAERTLFPFTLTYEPLPDDRLRVMQVETDTVFGRAVMSRR